VADAAARTRVSRAARGQRAAAGGVGVRTTSYLLSLRVRHNTCRVVDAVFYIYQDYPRIIPVF